MALHNQLLEQAIAFHQQGRISEAEAGYQAVLAMESNNADAIHLLGVIAIQSGRLSEGEQRIRKAIALRPSEPSYYANLGVALEKLTAWSEARDALLSALALKPDYAEAHHNLGIVLTKLGNLESSLGCFEKALELSPNYYSAYINLGATWYRLGGFSEAVRVYRQALQYVPDHADLYLNLGNALQELNRYDEAVVAYHQALSCSPNEFFAHQNLGLAYRALGRNDLAIQAIEKAWKISTSHAECLGLLINLQLQEHQWQDFKERSCQLISWLQNPTSTGGASIISPLVLLQCTEVMTPKLLLRIAQQWTAHQCHGFLHEVREADTSGQPEPLPKLLNLRSDATYRRVRIGYISADFREHPVGWIIPQTIESHDRSRMEVFGYSLGGGDINPLRQRLERAFDHFRNLQSLPHRVAADVIRGDNLDVLIDLQGHTDRARLPILALRPARIQINFLGYPGTMGAPFIDFILADRFVIPEDNQADYQEKVLYIDDCFLMNDGTKIEAARQRFRSQSRDAWRSQFGLPKDAFVFCGFSSAHKLTPRLFEVWLRILRKVPSSVLWLRAHSPSARQNLLSFAQEHQIASDRLIFAGQVSMLDHLARQAAADLFLDTFPYNQHSTASDALGMGLPLVTISGQHFASRVAGSLLDALGCQELIAGSIEEYENKSIRLALEPVLLQSLHQKLAYAVTVSDLWDGQAFARKLERALLG